MGYNGRRPTSCRAPTRREGSRPRDPFSAPSGAGFSAERAMASNRLLAFPQLARTRALHTLGTEQGQFTARYIRHYD
jgi:hypothetical protein